MQRRFEDCNCTCGCGFCKGWPVFHIVRVTPNGREIHSLEETKDMDFPYPPETDS